MSIWSSNLNALKLVDLQVSQNTSRFLYSFSLAGHTRGWTSHKTVEIWLLRLRMWSSIVEVGFPACCESLTVCMCVQSNPAFVIWWTDLHWVFPLSESRLLEPLLVIHATKSISPVLFPCGFPSSLCRCMRSSFDNVGYLSNNEELFLVLLMPPLNW
jgi:hypothetical protein